MASPTGSNPFLSLLHLPKEALDPIFQYVVHDKGFSALARTSRQCRDITYAILRSQWLRLNLPDADLPQGLVDLSSLMGRIEQLHPDDFETKPSTLFLSVAYEFTDLKATLPQGKLPLTQADLIVLQNQALHVELEESLCRIWKKIANTQHQLPMGTIPYELKTTAEIRSWLNDSNNAHIINGITGLDLSTLNLRVLPPELLKFTQLQKLDLSKNRFDFFPDIIVNFTGLQVLSLEDNSIRTIPKTIGTLTSLKALFLSKNLIETLPKEIGALIALETLHLCPGNIRALPEEFGALKELKVLKLGVYVDTIFDVIADLKKLEEFTFGVYHENPFIPHFIRISNKILSSNCPAIKNMSEVKERKEELARPPMYPLAKLYQSIIQNETEDQIKTLFSALSDDDKNLIYEHIWFHSGYPQTDDHQWGEHHVFDDMGNFYSAAYHAIISKRSRLLQEKKEQVYHNICKLSVNRYSNLKNWYQDLDREENRILLADAMAMLDTHGKDEE